MGYYTQYKLTIKRGVAYLNPKEREPVADCVKDYPDYGNEYTQLVDGGVISIRGNVADDFWRISRQFPDMLFSLYGQGEEHGDVWVEYFWAGNRQRRPAWFPGPNNNAWHGWEDG